MASQQEKLARLRAGVLPEPVERPVERPEPEAPKRGRPPKPEATVAMNLRLPQAHMRALVAMAAARSKDRVVTAQTVVLDLIAKAVAEQSGG